MAVWEISIGNEIVATNGIYINCTIELCNRKLEIDMFKLDIRGYEVILGMSWLSIYCAVIDCRIQKVILKMLHLP